MFLEQKHLAFVEDAFAFVWNHDGIQCDQIEQLFSPISGHTDGIITKRFSIAYKYFGITNCIDMIHNGCNK